MHDWIGQGIRLVGIAVASIWQYALLKRGATAQRRAKVRVRQLEAIIPLTNGLTSLYVAALSTWADPTTWTPAARNAFQRRTHTLYTHSTALLHTTAGDIPHELRAASAHFLAVYRQVVTTDPLLPVSAAGPALHMAYQQVGEQLQRLGIDLPHFNSMETVLDDGRFNSVS